MSKSSVAIIVAMLIGSVSLFGGNIFVKSETFDEALNKAKMNRRLLLTYVANPSVPCCIAMEKATFPNPEIRQLLKQSFYPVKINLSNEVGKQWAQEFNILKAPTLLFFDTQGTLIKQIENGVSSRELKSILEEVVFYNINGYWPLEAPPVVLTAAVPHQPTCNSSTSKVQKTLDCPVYKTQSHSTPFFKILLDKIPTTDTTINKLIKKVKVDYPEHPVCAKLIRDEENAYFQILIGHFSENEEAEAFLNNLKAEGIEDAEVFTTEDRP